MDQKAALQLLFNDVIPTSFKLFNNYNSNVMVKQQPFVLALLDDSTIAHQLEDTFSGLFGTIIWEEPLNALYVYLNDPCDLSKSHERVLSLCKSMLDSYLIPISEAKHDPLLNEPALCILGKHSHVQLFSHVLLSKLNNLKEIFAGNVLTLGDVVSYEFQKYCCAKIFRAPTCIQDFNETCTGLWIFGYGSLIHRPGELTRLSDQREWANLKGYSRRFYQGSPDHRGTFMSPGRVLTLIQKGDGFIWGVAFHVEPANLAEVLSYLTYREQGGYSLTSVQVSLESNSEVVDAITYIALPENKWYLGEASEESIALHALKSFGEITSLLC
jgi:cation transport protein ChaC